MASSPLTKALMENARLQALIADLESELHFRTMFAPRSSKSDFLARISKYIESDVSDETLFGGLELPEEANISKCWEEVCRMFDLAHIGVDTGDDDGAARGGGSAPAASKVKTLERSVYHPPLRGAIEAVLPFISSCMTCVYEQRVPGWNKEPDFLVKHARERSIGPRTVRLVGEAKTEKDFDMNESKAQALDYGTRVFWTQRDILRRADKMTDPIVLGFLTDFVHIRVFRLMSGVDEGKRPSIRFLWGQKHALACENGTDGGFRVTPGFCVLFKALFATAAVQSDSVFYPLLDEVSFEGKHVTLGDRLGMGGYSDVYAATVDGQEVAVKVLRWNTLGGEATFRDDILTHEVAALQQLESDEVEHVPRLVRRSGDGGRYLADSHAFAMTPVGAPVAEIAADFARQLADSESVDAREAIAVNFNAWLAHVGDGILAALRHAHGKRIVHLDVRPENVVWVGCIATGRAVLVDWGVHGAPDDRASGMVGVVEFAADSILESAALKRQAERGVTIRTTYYCVKPVFDFESLAYTLAVLAVGGEVPWRRGGQSQQRVTRFEAIRDARSTFFTNMRPCSLLMFKTSCTNHRFMDHFLFSAAKRDNGEHMPLYPFID
jgi:hypothetical protein